MEATTGLDTFTDLAIHIDNGLQKQREEKRGSTQPPCPHLALAPSSSSPEHMQVNVDCQRLTTKEKEQPWHKQACTTTAVSQNTYLLHASWTPARKGSEMTKLGLHSGTWLGHKHKNTLRADPRPQVLTGPPRHFLHLQVPS